MGDAERINKIMEHLGITSVTKFAKSIGKDRPDSIYNVLNGINGITKDLARHITINHNQLRYIWVLNGNGDMLLSDDEMKKRSVVPGKNICQACNDKDFIIENLKLVIEKQTLLI